VTEPQPPSWFEPPPQRVPARSPSAEERPHYRERRPVRWWAVLAGVVASAIWFVLIGAAAWSATSFVVTMLLGILLAGAATWVLTWRGDPGLGVGIGLMMGFALSLLFFLGGCYAMLDSLQVG
jgi:hypothetical protein